MFTSFSVDWIRATTKHHGMLYLIEKFSYGFDHTDWISTHGVNSYDQALKNPHGHMIMWSSYRDDMGKNILFDGRSCSELMAIGKDPIDIVKWLSEEEFKFTRLDLAIDIRDSKIKILELFECEFTGSVNNMPELYLKGKKAKGGATMYLGGRQSEKYLRIYDKAKEQGLKNVDWVRVEVELKGDTATRIARMMREMSYEEISDMTQAIIKGMYTPEHETFNQAIAQPAMRVGSTKNATHSTRDWLMTSVAKTFAKTMIELPHVDLKGEFMREVELQLKRMMLDQELKKGTVNDSP